MRRGCIDDVREAEVLRWMHEHEVDGDYGHARPDWRHLERLEEQGRLVVVMVEDGDAAVGYAVVGLVPDLTRGGTTAWVSAIYLAPKYRKADALGRRLMAEAEWLARLEGARQVYWPAPSGGPLDRLLGRPGSRYRAHEVVYVRDLEETNDG
jgi:GNAT superfamily N-acetyltransferase